MKCELCDEAATTHVTEMVDGKPTEHHVCETHARHLNALPPPSIPEHAPTGEVAFLLDTALLDALRDQGAQEKLLAHLLPALCVALLDPTPEIRIAATFFLTRIAADAESVKQALRDALNDQDERVRKASQIALESIESGRRSWLWEI
jgi:hypothetical protein